MIAIFSDIHGNLPALESVIDDVERYSVSKIISLGDVCGYYPYINEVIDILKSKNVVNLIGNHDKYILDDTECPRSIIANLCLNYQRNIITSENKKWLRKSLLILETDRYIMVHGGLENYIDEYIYVIKNEYFELYSQKYFFCGHTHVQKHIKLKNGKEFINPGSVGQPRDGNRKAAYCIFDEERDLVKMRRVSYDIDKISDKMRRLGFENSFFSNLYAGTRIHGKIDKIMYEDIN